MTLVELLVAMVVSGIVVTLVATVTIQAFRIQGDTLTRERDSTAASLAMETMSRDIRQALAPQLDDDTSVPAFTVATPDRLTVISWVSAASDCSSPCVVDPVQVSYRLSDGTLTRTVRQPDVPGKGTRSEFTGRGVSTSAVLVRSVAAQIASSPLFTYTQTTGDSATTYATADDLAGIKKVKISLTIDSDGSTRLPGTTLINQVVCLNL